MSVNVSIKVTKHFFRVRRRSITTGNNVGGPVCIVGSTKEADSDGTSDKECSSQACNDCPNEDSSVS